MAITLGGTTSGLLASGTVLTVTLPPYDANSFIVLFLSRSQTGTFTFSSEIASNTSLANVSGRLAAIKLTPNGLSQTSFTVTSTTAYWQWMVAVFNGVNGLVTIPSAINAIGTNTTALIQVPTTTLGFTSQGDEVAVYAAGVNASATWTTTSDTFYNTTVGNSGMMLLSKLIGSGLTSVSYADQNRGNDGTNRLESSLSFVLTPTRESGPAGSQIKVWNGSAFVSKPIKVFTGSIWEQKSVKRWNGSSWITL